MPKRIDRGIFVEFVPTREEKEQAALKKIVKKQDKELRELRALVESLISKEEKKYESQ